MIPPCQQYIYAKPNSKERAGGGGRDAIDTKRQWYAHKCGVKQEPGSEGIETLYAITFRGIKRVRVAISARGDGMHSDPAARVYQLLMIL